MRNIISKVSMIIAVLLIYLGIEDMSAISALTRPIPITKLIASHNCLNKSLAGVALNEFASYPFFITGIVFLIIFAIINFNHKRKMTLIPSICAITTSAYIFITYNFVYFLIFLSVSIIATLICDFFYNKNIVNGIFALLTGGIFIAEIITQIVRILTINIDNEMPMQDILSQIDRYSFISKLLLLISIFLFIANIIYNIYVYFKAKNANLIIE